MEKTILSCPQCGRQLAKISGELGFRRITHLGVGVEVRVARNALGESLGWLRCVPCRADQRFDGKYWLGWHQARGHDS